MPAVCRYSGNGPHCRTAATRVARLGSIEVKGLLFANWGQLLLATRQVTCGEARRMPSLPPIFVSKTSCKLWRQRSHDSCSLCSVLTGIVAQYIAARSIQLTTEQGFQKHWTSCFPIFRAHSALLGGQQHKGSKRSPSINIHRNRRANQLTQGPKLEA